MARLSVADTRFQKSEDRLWTHQHWRTTARRQIDYILVDTCLATMIQDADVDDHLGAGSDHRPVTLRMLLTKKPSQRKSKMRKPRRSWAPEQDDQGRPAAFHQALSEGLHARSKEDVDATTKAVVGAATSHQLRLKRNELCPGNCLPKTSG